MPAARTAAARNLRALGSPHDTTTSAGNRPRLTMKIHELLHASVVGAGEKVELLFLALFSLGRAPSRHRVVVRQVARLCTEGLHIVAICGFFGAMTLVVVVSAGDWQGLGRGQLGLTIVRLTVGELGPLLAAGALALTLGAPGPRPVPEAPSVSLGDYAHDVLLPRLISLAIATPILWGLCTVLVVLGLAVVGCGQAGIGPRTLVESLESMWTWSEIEAVWAAFLVGGLKASVLGVVLAVAATGPVGHGRACEGGSARGPLVAIVVANYFLAWVALSA